MTEYEAEFLKLSRYVPGMVATEQDKCTGFEFEMRFELMIQVALLQESVSKLWWRKPKSVRKSDT
ncbi:acetyl-coenzyme A carboxylase carboxyl transferase subunit alpha, chloroplastic-like [Gossypium australe]|uniref:Acetyl-coenzyme A carboxylase carboxyl transferase subunit alpha, chloroplastic-like n=1 Tax=Gossypium australe TaxID=47621 RepID=A0A5B6V966_9ROSI|nr:acetyl-coenzyme A carboxylase carboxyl transferase subunit alpha, chloroplastic-like [Gossypium australe]